MKTIYYLGIWFLLAMKSTGQVSMQIPWQPESQNFQRWVYHPEPILFVHGVNANDNSWSNAVTFLKPVLVKYDLPGEARRYLIGPFSNMNVRQEAYLHTFNYGDPPGTNTHARQTFQPVMWNAWKGDLRGTPATNIFHNPNIWGPLPNDSRVTLDERIHGRNGSGGFSGIRQAYALDPTDPTSYPNIVLVAHSLGGLLSHHYMLRNASNHGVRRLITVAGAHQGSMLANWLTWYQNNGGHVAASYDGHHVGYWIRTKRFLGPRVSDILSGFFEHWNLGAVQDATTIGRHGVFQYQNQLLPNFWNNPAPRVEYVFNAYQMPAAGSDYTDLRSLVDDAHVVQVFQDGDGFVPVWSAFGKNDSDRPSIWNGRGPNAPNIHTIDPVLFGVWPDTDHTAATSHHQSLLQSLCGVPYIWPQITLPSQNIPPALPVDPPDYAQTYSENQSFSKYLPPPLGSGEVHTDEPGIRQMELLYETSARNPFIIPTMDTWTNDETSYPLNIFTWRTDLLGYQVIGTSDPESDGRVRILALAGAKSRAQQPMDAAVNGDFSYYWAKDGNEYLPASLDIHIKYDSDGADTSGILASPTRMTDSQCLVWQLDNGDVRQYALFRTTTYGPLSSESAPYYFFAAGTNIAGLFTPIAERGFDVPVDSATVVNLLCGINEREAAVGVEQTRWSTWVTEWIDLSSTNTTITLNFFPKVDPNTWGFWLEDAFTETLYEDWEAYDNVSKTFSISPPAAPRCLKVTYEAFLGGLSSSSNTYQGGTNFCIVPPLTNASSLAGVPATSEFVQQMKDACQTLVPLYVDSAKAVDGTFNSWFANPTNACIGFPRLTESNLVGVAPGYFESTTNMVTGQEFVQLHAVVTNLKWAAGYSSWYSANNYEVDVWKCNGAPANYGVVKAAVLNPNLLSGLGGWPDDFWQFGDPWWAGQFIGTAYFGSNHVGAAIRAAELSPYPLTNAPVALDAFASRFSLCSAVADVYFAVSRISDWVSSDEVYGSHTNGFFSYPETGWPDISEDTYDVFGVNVSRSTNIIKQVSTQYTGTNWSWVTGVKHLDFAWPTPYATPEGEDDKQSMRGAVYRQPFVLFKFDEGTGPNAWRFK